MQPSTRLHCCGGAIYSSSAAVESILSADVESILSTSCLPCLRWRNFWQLHV